MLEIRVLGTAAGGGFPQWNCACTNCRLARQGVLSPRLQSGLAVSADGHAWHLVNASPDVAHQIERFLPRGDSSGRSNPVSSIFVTNADLDHTLGILQLREGQCMDIHAPGPVMRSLREGFGLDRILDHYGGIAWRESSEQWLSIGALEARAVPLCGTEPPRYDREAGAGMHAGGYLFRANGKTAGIFPDVAVLDDNLLAILSDCDRAWFDGTFWSDDEMLDWNGRTAGEMGHVPVAGSLPRLASLGPGRVSLLHINNTNPILRPDSEERRIVTEAGVSIAEDGDHWIG